MAPPVEHCLTRKARLSWALLPSGPQAHGEPHFRHKARAPSQPFLDFPGDKNGFGFPSLFTLSFHLTWDKAIRMERGATLTHFIAREKLTRGQEPCGRLTLPQPNPSPQAVPAAPVTSPALPAGSPGFRDSQDWKARGEASANQHQART